MRLFPNIENISAEIGQMENDERNRREDRATVSAFYNGQPPYTQEEAEALGLGVNVNNLFGYDVMSKAKSQLMALYTKPARLFEVTIDSAPGAMKQGWEMTATREFNRVMKKSGRMKPQYEGVAGDATMHGEGIFFFPDVTDWCPRHLPLSKRLVPSKAKMDKTELTHFAVATELTFHDLFTYRRLKAEGWNMANISTVLKQAADNAEGETGSVARTLSDSGNPEEMEYQRQANSAVDRAFRLTLPVYYFFQMRPDQIGKPYDLTILARYEEANGDKKANVLYESEFAFDSINAVLHPFFMDCIVGGEALWGRVLGLGHLNYSLAWHVEVLLSRMMQATMEGAMNFWQVKDANARDVIEQIMLKHNGVLPEGVEFMQNRVKPDFTGLMTMIQMFRQQGSTNSNALAPNDGGKNDVLEVQAIAQSDEANAAGSQRVSNWFDYMNRMGDVMLSRFTNPYIRPCDKGFSEIMDFQAAMKRAGIPLHMLRPTNVKVTMARIAGDGLRQQQMAEAGFLMQNINMYPPESQQKIKRRVTAAITDDYELAEQLVPIENKMSDSQAIAIMTENNTFMEQGDILAMQHTTVPTHDTDVDYEHLSGHLQLLQGLVMKAAQLQKAAFTEEQMGAFQVGGAHVVAHIQKIESMGDKQGAKQAMDALTQIANAGQKMANNLQQQQKGEQGEEMSPEERARLQLEFGKLQLQIQKFQHGVQKFDRTQSLREHSTAASQVLALERDRREEMRTRHDVLMDRSSLPAPTA